MSLRKASTRSRQWMQNHQSDLTIGLLILNTVLLLIIAIALLTQDNASQALQQQKIIELGGKHNYDRYQHIMHSDSYRNQRTFSMDQQYKIFFPSSDDEDHTIE